MNKRSVLVVLIVLMFSSVFASSPGLIPVPESYEMRRGEFVFSPKTSIILQPDNEAMRNAVVLFQELFVTTASYPLNIIQGKSGKNVIVCRIDTQIKGNEAYYLDVTTNKLEIKASTPTGIFYALQSIRQLLPPEINADKKVAGVKWSVPCLTVKDAPAFAYRGMMLDVSRHFMSKEFVMRFIDMLAFHKLNTFHWHLTDDQGWRIEIEQYPKLTEIGAFRRMEIDGHKNAPDWKWKMVDHGGFYTKDDIREVIAYANKRHVNIIPEIELPGHALAALSAYPELSCSGGPFEVVGRWGIFHDIYCTKEETMVFLENVLAEVAELFPGEYIHLGGDEAPKTRWKRCKACQDRMKAEGISDETQLQAHVTARMEKFLNAKGKKVICWDDAVEAEVSKTITVMSWRSEEGGIVGARRGNPVIMTPHKSVYFDYYQGDRETEPLTIGGNLPLEKVYAYNPIPLVLSVEEAKLIKGTQANVWTEYMPNEKHVEYMVFPRIAALAEVSWSPQHNKNYDDFISRLKKVIKHYDALNINYRKLD
ncbi:MAG: beta-N-acetylhexosaminidase [Paludibacter sp.]|nr:beta-N-acetylhexosaminidase [Paludibacter sp.]